MFVYIHPYMDGNGRMGRFLMNVMMASGGYPWTVIPVGERKTYMEALEKASVGEDIGPFADFLAGLVKKGLAGEPLPEVPKLPHDGHTFAVRVSEIGMGFKGLFIKIDRYASTEINWLGCARRDARALHALFTDTLGGETALLTDEQATVAAIEERFGQLAACSADDVVVVAFSESWDRDA